MKSLIVAKTGQCDNYCIYLASQYFEEIDDYVNLALGCKRFRFNLDRYFYNPLPLTKTTRLFFPFLRTQYVYSNEDELFFDEKIKYYEILYPITYLEGMKIKKRKEMKGKEIKFHDMTYENSDWKNSRIVRKLTEKTMKIISIPKEVSSISYSCFERCEKLRSIYLHDNIHQIELQEVYVNSFLLQYVQLIHDYSI